MTLAEIADEVRRARFTAAGTGEPESWVRHAYGRVWSAEEWTFKRVGPTAFPVSAGATDLPDDADRVLVLTDPEQEEPLTYVEPGDFDRYLSPGLPAGGPSWFTIYNRQIVVAPVPDGGYTFDLSYQRRLSHFNVSAEPVAGHMVAGDDSPLWPDDHHDILITGGLVRGLQLKNDPTWPPLADEFRQQLQDMRDSYLDKPGPVQYGRDAL